MNPPHQTTPPERGPDSNTSSISCDEAARLMISASAADVETRYGGGTIEVWTIHHERDLVYASGPRLQLWGGMQLWWRFLDDQGTPHRAELQIVQSQYKSDARATLVLQVVAVEVDRAARRYDRCAVTGSVSLTAVHCARIVDTDRLRATFRDLSLSGVALHVDDDRVKQGDRFVLRTRFIEGAIDTDIRVARVLELPGSRGLLVGAFFVQPTAQLAAIVEQVMARFGQHRHTTVGSGIRASLGIAPQVATPMYRPVTVATSALFPRPGLA